MSSPLAGPRSPSGLCVTASRSTASSPSAPSKKELKVDVEGAITLDHVGLMMKAAVAGIGVAYVVLTEGWQAIAGERLVEVLTEWTPPFSGHRLYYPSHRLVPTGSGHLRGGNTGGRSGARQGSAAQ
jgi:DNA-binding transcriptional LysR family regulator